MIGTKRNGGASDRVRQAADQVKPVAAQTAAQVKPVAAQVAAQVKPVAAQVAAGGQAQVKPVAAQVAAQVKPVAAQVTAQVKPVARSAGIATRRGVYRTRVWVAPQLHHSGQVLEETVAPKVSALLAAAAERIEPVKPQRSRWPRVIGLSILAAAASAAAAAVLRRRAQQGLGTPTADTAPDSTPDTAQTPDRPATSDAQNSQVRTP